MKSSSSSDVTSSLCKKIRALQTTIVHVHTGRKDQKRIIRRLKKFKTETYSDNPYTIVIQHKSRKFRKIKKILRRYKKRVTVLSEGHNLDGKIRSHLRIRSDSELTTEANTVNYGNLPPVIAIHYAYPTQNGTQSPKIGIISLGGTYLTADLNTYWTTYLGHTGTPNVNYVNGISGSTNKPNNPIKSNDGSDENTLDIEIIIGLCPKAAVKMYFGTNTVVGFYNAIAKAISDGNQIISISWGGPEASFGTVYLNSYNELLQYATTKGIAVCVASGDNGSTDGTSALALDFPASSPYAIACGGTTIGNPDTTWSYNSKYQWGTGGGLSNYFTSAVTQVIYPALGSTEPSVNNLITSKKRSSPDIALNADPLTGWTIYFNKVLYTSSFGGTSCVAPAFSAFLGLVNKNFTTNPITSLYSAYSACPSCYRDITTGSNDNLANSSNVYTARTGFDQCTGMGSITGTTLANYLLTH